MIPTTPARTLTISIPRTTLGHALTGIGIAAIAAGAIALHTVTAPGSPYRATLLIVGGLAGCTALAYWLWCTLQQLRAEQAATAAEQEERDRLAAAQASAILEAFEQAHRDHKLAAEQRRELIGAVEALQDCYLDEGTIP